MNSYKEYLENNEKFNNLKKSSTIIQSQIDKLNQFKKVYNNVEGNIVAEYKKNMDDCINNLNKLKENIDQISKKIEDKIEKYDELFRECNKYKFKTKTLYYVNSQGEVVPFQAMDKKNTNGTYTPSKYYREIEEINKKDDGYIYVKTRVWKKVCESEKAGIIGSIVDDPNDLYLKYCETCSKSTAETKISFSDDLEKQIDVILSKPYTTS